MTLMIPGPQDFSPVDDYGWTYWVWHLGYIDPDANSNKFYRVMLAWNEAEQDARVLYEWGRSGTSGQSRLDVGTHLTVMTKTGARKVEQKLAKGYTILDQIPYHPDNQDCSRLGINVYALGKVALKEKEEGRERIPTINDVATAVDRAMQMATRNDSVDMVDAAITAAEMKSGIQTLQQKLDELKAQAEFAEIALHANT